MSAWNRAGLVTIAVGLAACSSSGGDDFDPNGLGSPNLRPSYVKGAIDSQVYDGTGDDLLTAGLGKAGLAGAAPTVATPASPTAAELRRVAIYNNYAFETEVLVASVRHPIHVVQAALIGADVCTIPFKVITQLAQHPLTDLGLSKFLEDAKKIPKE